MDIDTIREQMRPWLKNKPLEESDFCIVWLSNVATYAFCANIEPFPYMVGWFDVTLIVFDRIPPRVWGWRLSEQHVNGDMFTLGGVPACIVPLEMSDEVPEGNGRDLSLEDGGNDELIKAKPVFDDDGGGE